MLANIMRSKFFVQRKGEEEEGKTFAEEPACVVSSWAYPRPLTARRNDSRRMPLAEESVVEWLPCKLKK